METKGFEELLADMEDMLPEERGPAVSVCATLTALTCLKHGLDEDAAVRAVILSFEALQDRAATGGLN